MTVTLDRNVEAFLGAPRQLFINGQWADCGVGEDVRDAQSRDG